MIQYTLDAAIYKPFLMKLSLRIPIITVLMLFLTLFINIFLLQYSIKRHIPAYVEAVDSSNNEKSKLLDPNNLEAVFSLNNLDPKTQEDYQKAISELANITNSLKSLSDNPELYVGTAAQDIQTGNSFHLEATDSSSGNLYKPSYTKTDFIKKILWSIANPLNFSTNTPEWVFLWGIIKDFLLFNGLWFIVITGLYVLWIRKLFSPIHIIIHRLREFIQTPHSQRIIYTKNDEFRPLIDTVNELHSSLIIQEQIRNNFLADLSHEIRTPMTAVRCMLEGIEDTVIPLDDKTIPIIHSEIKRLVNITEKIMEYESFLSDINHAIKKEKISPSEIINMVIIQYETQLQKSAQSIKNTVKPSEKVLIDTDQFMQILHNIFSNFLKYAGEKSTLTCSYKQTKYETILTFSDNGVGITEEDIPFIKEKFFKKDSGRTQNEYPSMGIGISIIDRIMTLHGGSLSLQTNKPHWLTFILSFPKSHA